MVGMGVVEADDLDVALARVTLRANQFPRIKS